MWALFITLAICGTAIFLALRVEQYFRDYYKARREFAQALSAPGKQEPVAIDPMPSDLMALALMESEDWAKQAALSTMMDLYEKTHDWDRVRTLYGAPPRSDN